MKLIRAEGEEHRIRNKEQRTKNKDNESLGSLFFNLCSSEIEHGGNIYKLAYELGIPENKVIDFSASINPLGVSGKVKATVIKELGNSHNYPDPDTKELREKLSQFYNIEPETIICSNGSTELIYLVPRVLKPRTVLIPAPTFAEYERACKTSYELRIKSYELGKENNLEIMPEGFIEAMQGCDMAFLCNPNNPTGSLLKRDIVLKIAEAARHIKCVLVVDEAFIDFCSDESIIRDVQDNPYLIALRSMTKFYALSGLRVGYGVFPLNLINKVKDFKEPWTVSSLAQKAAIAALRDRGYIRKTQRLVKSEKEFLESSFKKIGIEFFPTDANFYLLKTRGDNRLDLRLKEKGILVRNCSNFKGLDDSYIRVAVKSRKHNRILLRELSRLCRLI